MHFSQNNLSLVFASLGRNSYRAFNNILSDAPLRKKSKPLSLGLHKTSDFQYRKKASITTKHKQNECYSFCEW